jgi:hypothetical protein
MSGKDDDVDELTASFKGMNLKKRVTFNPLMGSDSIDPAKRLPMVTGNRRSGNPYTLYSTNPVAKENLQQWQPTGGRKKMSLKNKKNAKRKTRKTRKGKRSRKSSIRKTKTRKHRK